MTTNHNRIVSAVLSIAGTAALVAFAAPGAGPRSAEVAAAPAPVAAPVRAA